jgi:hypothetical protein
MKKNKEVDIEEIRKSVREHRQATHKRQLERFHKSQVLESERNGGKKYPSTLKDFIKENPPKLESGKSIQKKRPVCSKCRGQGVLNHYVHRDEGRCYQCQGTGSASTPKCTGHPSCYHCEGIRRSAYKIGSNYYKSA